MCTYIYIYIYIHVLWGGELRRLRSPLRSRWTIILLWRYCTAAAKGR